MNMGEDEEAASEKQESPGSGLLLCGAEGEDDRREYAIRHGI